MPPRFSKESHYKEGSYKDVHYKEAHYREGSYKEAHYREGSYRDSHHRDYRDYRDYRDDHYIRDKKASHAIEGDRSKRNSQGRFSSSNKETAEVPLRNGPNAASNSSHSASSSGNKTHNLLTKNGLIINSSSNSSSFKAGQPSRKAESSETTKTGELSSKADSASNSAKIKLNIDLANQQNGGKQPVATGGPLNGNAGKTTILSGSSKSSSFDQQDSGIDLSDQLASNASSQRSSPGSNAGKTNGSAVAVSCLAGQRPHAACKTTASTVSSLISATANGKAGPTKDELSAASSAAKVCTAIFENSKIKHSAVLDKFSSKLVSFDTSRSLHFFWCLFACSFSFFSS